jgi:pyruvate/2-oxoglutarate/acetoin dehydrogenase E1 component
MNKELNKLGKKVVALHECSKRGMTKKGYAMFKEAMQAVMMLEANGCKSEVIEKAKAILAEYYDTYKTQVKKDTTRVIVEAKNSAEAAAKKAAKEQKKQLKGWLKEVVNNVQHMREAIAEGSDARIGFHANQIKLAVEEIISAVGTELTM